jgi:RNA 2',3'-cyclic 3'-phosphodiesterase
MPRLFSALQLPAMVRTHLSMVRGEIGGARWMAAENLHITLRFFGDVSDEIADEIAAGLDEMQFAPITLTIAGTSTFGGGSETAIYAAVVETPELLALQRAHERLARAVGLGAPEYAFKPHITLARARHPRPSLVARFLAETGALKIAPFEVAEFALLSSRPGRGGGPYATELVVPLV